MQKKHRKLNCPAASGGVSTLVTPTQAGVQKALQDWIPAFAGMTKPQQAAGN